MSSAKLIVVGVFEGCSDSNFRLEDVCGNVYKLEVVSSGNPNLTPGTDINSLETLLREALLEGYTVVITSYKKR